MAWHRESFAGSGHRPLRVGTVAVLTTATGALIASQPWYADRPQRFVVVSATLLVVLGAHLLALRQLTSSTAAVAPFALAAAGLSAVAATALWILPRLSAPGLPVRADGALVAAEVATVVAAALAAFGTRDLRQAGLAGLWSAALSTFLLFAGSLLAFTFIPSSVPNTQGRYMLPSATAAQRLAENRIEAPDGYLGLLALTLLLALLLCVVCPRAPRAAARPAARSLDPT